MASKSCLSSLSRNHFFLLMRFPIRLLGIKMIKQPRKHDVNGVVNVTLLSSLMAQTYNCFKMIKILVASISIAGTFICTVAQIKLAAHGVRFAADFLACCLAKCRAETKQAQICYSRQVYITQSLETFI